MTNPPYDNNILELRQIVNERLDFPEPKEPVESVELPQDAQVDARIWAYLGVVGGAGVTSLAVQAAWQLAQNKTNVLLIDLDFERGDCAAYFDVRPSTNITELNQTEGRMDENLAATFIQTVSPNLSLISSAPELGGNDLVSPSALLSLLDSVSGMFGTIILDIPPMWRSWTQAAIGAADKFALVTEARVPALHQTSKLIEDITGAIELAEKPEVIINKFERRSLRGGLTLADAQKVLGDVVCSQICVDEETLRTTINTGKPAGALKPNSRYTKSVVAHVNDWVGITQVTQKERRIARR